MAVEAGLQPIPGYRLTQPLGAGAFGEVWEAVCEDKSHVALKFLNCRQHSRSMVANEVRILRELAGLKHPNIIPLLGVHAWSKYLVLIMERADGSLADLQDAYRETTGGYIPADHALDLLDQAAEALDFLATAQLPAITTKRGLQHCDIKPSNLLVVGETLKVADFGLCTGSGWVTHTKGWKGTLPYAAPELYNGAGAPGTDQYALAVTFCQMVMGPRPFFPGVLAGNPPAGLPIDLTKLRDKEYQVIARALHPYPSARYPTCKVFLEDLRDAITHPRGGDSTHIYPRGTHGSLNKRPSGRHSAVKV